MTILGLVADEKTRRLILELFERGVEIEAIADQVKVSVSVVRVVLKLYRRIIS